MHSEARLLMHKNAGETEFKITNTISDAAVFKQYCSRLEFTDTNPNAEIYLSSISIIPQNIDKLFEDQPIIRPELPPGVRRIDLDDAPDEVKPAPRWTVLDYTQHIKYMQVRIDVAGYTLVNSPLSMFTPNTGPVVMLNKSESILQQALLLDLHNGFILTVPSRKIKQQGVFWIYLNNAMLKETVMDFLVVISFEVEPFNLSQQIWPNMPSYPQPGLGYHGTGLRYDNNTGSTGGISLTPGTGGSAPAQNWTNVVVSYSAPTGTTRMTINGVESRFSTPTGEMAGPGVYAISGLSSDFIRFYIDDVLQEGTVYRVPEGRTLHVTSAGMEADQTRYVVRGNLV